MDFVAVASAFFFSGNDSSLFKLHHDALHRTLGDPHLICNIAQSLPWIFVQANQHVRVICEEGP